MRLTRSDGTGDHELAAEVPGDHLQPDWSPDGGRLLFTRRTGVDDLFELHRDRGRAQKLLECVYPCIGNESGAYSPDGRRIAFIRMFGPLAGGRPADCGLWIFGRRTGQLTRLTSHPRCQDREAYPRWSPDGSTLVFFRERYGSSGATTATAIYTMAPNSGKPRQLTPWKLVAGSPDWSPDGRLIVFSTYPLGFFPAATVSNLYTMRPDGTKLRRLTNYTAAQGRASHPRWLPDGRGILYVLGRRGHRELWLTTPDGTRRTRIKAGGDSWHPAWRPLP